MNWKKNLPKEQKERKTNESERKKPEMQERIM